MHKLFSTVLLLLCLVGKVEAQLNRVPTWISITSTVPTVDSVEFTINWASVSGALSYDITFRSMPRIKKLELVRVVSGTIFKMRVARNDILYPQIILYATSIASLSTVKTDSLKYLYVFPPPPPPDTIFMDTLWIPIEELLWH